MHVGFDISQTGSGKAGCGYFAHAMIRSMLKVAPQHRYALYPSFGDFYFDFRMPLLSPYRGDHVSYGPRHLSREGASEFWNAADVENALGQPDVIHSNNFWSPVQLKSSRLIYTLYDLGFVANPDWSTEANRVGCFEGVFRSSVAADWVIAISDYSRMHYLKTFPHFPPDRIRVVSPCSRFEDSTLQGSRPPAVERLSPGEFWLSVGTIEPRKNQRMLVEAYAQYLQNGGRAMPLVLSGGNGWLMDGFRDYLDDLGVSTHVILTGYVSDDELIWLYRNCYAHLYPSFFEGFGLPVLEGMQFGAPTLCSNTSSIPEVSGNGAILLSPVETAGWVEAMITLAVDRARRERLVALARQQAATFDWQRSAEALISIYEEAVNSPLRADMKTQKQNEENSR